MAQAKYDVDDDDDEENIVALPAGMALPGQARYLVV
jgi:hypothetical protein